jgi:hypothetical protein
MGIHGFMGLFTRSLPIVCLGMLPAFAGGCSGIGSGVTTGSTDAQAAKLAASGVSQPLARSVEVATTAACARAYGYSLDPARLRETYLNYENRQGASREQLRAVEQSYDATYQQVSGSGVQSSSCSGRDAAIVKADVQRYAAGYFVPRTPPPKEVFDVNKVWADQECGGRC